MSRKCYLHLAKRVRFSLQRSCHLPLLAVTAECVCLSFPLARVACAQRAPLYSEFAFFAVTSVTIPLGLICEK